VNFRVPIKVMRLTRKWGNCESLKVATTWRSWTTKLSEVKFYAILRGRENEGTSEIFCNVNDSPKLGNFAHAFPNLQKFSLKMSGFESISK